MAKQEITFDTNNIYINGKKHSSKTYKTCSTLLYSCHYCSYYWYSNIYRWWIYICYNCPILYMAWAQVRISIQRFSLSP